MKTIYTKSILLMTVVLAAALAQAHVEPGSFLNKPARTVNQLVAQTERDPQVLDRYERHFQMSKSDLITYFESLHVGKLQSTGSYVVYNCHDDEVIRARVFRLKAGMPIFADNSGKAILKISCGNPMVAPTPTVAIHVKPTPPEQHHYEAPPAPAPPPQVIVVPAAPAAPVPPPVAPVVNNYQGGTVTNNNNSSSSKSYSSLFLLPIVLVFDTHHSHNTTIIKKQPTPEPASMLIMGFGAASLLIRKRKASKASV